MPGEVDCRGCEGGGDAREGARLWLGKGKARLAKGWWLGRGKGQRVLLLAFEPDWQDRFLHVARRAEWKSIQPDWQDRFLQSRPVGSRPPWSAGHPGAVSRSCYFRGAGRAGAAQAHAHPGAPATLERPRGFVIFRGRLGAAQAHAHPGAPAGRWYPMVPLAPGGVGLLKPTPTLEHEGARRG
jgi:hypothetical protein